MKYRGLGLQIEQNMASLCIVHGLHADTLDHTSSRGVGGCHRCHYIVSKAELHMLGETESLLLHNSSRRVVLADSRLEREIVDLCRQLIQLDE